MQLQLQVRLQLQVQLSATVIWEEADLGQDVPAGREEVGVDDQLRRHGGVVALETQASIHVTQPSLRPLPCMTTPTAQNHDHIPNRYGSLKYDAHFPES